MSNSELNSDNEIKSTETTCYEKTGHFLHRIEYEVSFQRNTMFFILLSWGLIRFLSDIHYFSRLGWYGICLYWDCIWSKVTAVRAVLLQFWVFRLLSWVRGLYFLKKFTANISKQGCLANSFDEKRQTWYGLATSYELASYELAEHPCILINM